MSGHRAFCWKCRRPGSMCFCADAVAVDTRVHFVILQHPRERKRTTGTAQIAKLSLKRCELLTGIDFDRHSRVNELLADPGRNCYVLYPGPSAQCLAVQDFAERFLERMPTVFVIDGTWSTAKSLLNQNCRIASLPRVSFPQNGASRYGFRAQPRLECLSTVEAICRIIELLEPERNSARILQILWIFDRMVERQLQYTALK